MPNYRADPDIAAILDGGLTVPAYLDSASWIGYTRFSMRPSVGAAGAPVHKSGGGALTGIPECCLSASYSIACECEAPARRSCR